jgi:hypothetical protein
MRLGSRTAAPVARHAAAFAWNEQRAPHFVTNAPGQRQPTAAYGPAWVALPTAWTWRLSLTPHRARDAPVTRPLTRDLSPQASDWRYHRRSAVVDRVDDLARINSLEIDRRDPEVRMPELPLDDRQRDPFVSPLDRSGCLGRLARTRARLLVFGGRQKFRVPVVAIGHNEPSPALPAVRARIAA